MRLERIFEQGHGIARRADHRDGVRVVQQPPRPPFFNAGYYVLREGALAEVVVGRKLELIHLAKRLLREEVDTDGWAPDVDHCWCDDCTRGRRHRSTLAD